MYMKRIAVLLLMVTVALHLVSCSVTVPNAQIAATTLPVYEFAAHLCRGTGIDVARIITENVSCLHDYTLQVNQMRTIENAQVIIISGLGLEDSVSIGLSADALIDASSGIPLLYSGSHDTHEHQHEPDPHIWLSPANARSMSLNIYKGLCAHYPEHRTTFAENYSTLEAEINQLEAYANEYLKNLSCRKIITFHNGFAYMADAFDLEIVHAIEEESGSEASAAELIQLTKIVTDHQLNAVFIERNGSSSAAQTIAAETGVSLFQLDMAMAGDSYFEAMYYNIDTLKEALE